jgi:hypothetical protein
VLVRNAVLDGGRSELGAGPAHVLDGSLDARMANTLIEKQEVIEKALDRETTVDVYGASYESSATPSVRDLRSQAYPRR